MPRSAVPRCRIAARRITTALALLALAIPSAPLAAQGEIRGRVLADDGRTPVANAELRLLGLTLGATTDSAGRFALPGIPRGGHVLVVRAVGFGADTSEVTFSSNETLFKDIALRRTTQVLEPVNVRADEAKFEAPWRGDFLRRREAGIGRQLDRDALEKLSNRSMADVLSLVPGVVVRRGNGNKAWASAGRSVQTGSCAFCRDGGQLIDRADVAAGARPACYMDVYMDGVMIYSMGNASPGAAPTLFDVNSLRPEQIEAIEVYGSASQIPAQYNRTGAGCGVMLIWTRQ